MIPIFIEFEKPALGTRIFIHGKLEIQLFKAEMTPV
jgi:hypothetical protein